MCSCAKSEYENYLFCVPTRSMPRHGPGSLRPNLFCWNSRLGTGYHSSLRFHPSFSISRGRGREIQTTHSMAEGKETPPDAAPEDALRVARTASTSTTGGPGSTGGGRRSCAPYFQFENCFSLVLHFHSVENRRARDSIKHGQVSSRRHPLIRGGPAPQGAEKFAPGRGCARQQQFPPLLTFFAHTCAVLRP